MVKEMKVTEGQLLWEPSQVFKDESQMSKYMAWLEREKGLSFERYQDLWKWSVDHLEDFWVSIWDYFAILSDAPYDQVVSSLEMGPHVEWFKGAEVNFAENILRAVALDKPAIHSLSEIRSQTTMNGDELHSKVRQLATFMRRQGVMKGDAVCSVLPNIPETCIAMLATISIGAIWSSAAPEFGSKTILDRFSQIKPKLIFMCDGYVFGGKAFDKSEVNQQIVDELEGSIKHVVFLPYHQDDVIGPEVKNGACHSWNEALSEIDPGASSFIFERVPNGHPLWVLFSSGTTGLPKAIVHNHVGVLLEFYKLLSLHFNLDEDKAAFFYTTTGWVMFNLQIGMLGTGSAIILYDGNPAYPGPDILWKMASETGATMFGASPTYVQVMEKCGIVPKDSYDLSKLECILLSGSPAMPESFAWFYENVKENLWLTSQSGGTELASAFVGSNPLEPVYAGEIQGAMLGMAVESWDDNLQACMEREGELVCLKPFPSMPIYFLNDKDGTRYFNAYFADYENVWKHGDFIKINQRGGCYVYGRSDATLNRYGVRIGTAELYRVVEQLSEIADSLVVGFELPNGEFFMPMFLQLEEGIEFDHVLEEKIKRKLREECSPRHVPDNFYLIDEVPYTLTGKKQEIPVRNILLGRKEIQSLRRDTMRNPHAIDYFIKFAQTENWGDVKLHSK